MPNKAPRSMTPIENVEINRHVHELLDKTFIRGIKANLNYPYKFVQNIKIKRYILVYFITTYSIISIFLNLDGLITQCKDHNQKWGRISSNKISMCIHGGYIAYMIQFY